MKIRCIHALSLLLACGTAGAQQGKIKWFPDGEYTCSSPEESTGITSAWCKVPTQAEIDAHKPRTQECPKYQHVDHWIGRCGPSHCQSNSDSWISSCDAVCEPVPPDHCVDDLHVVTEKEWQDLQTRLKELEAPDYPGVGDSSGGIVNINLGSGLEPEQPQQTAMIEDDGPAFITCPPLAMENCVATICSKPGQIHCVDVVCEGRNTGEGCPNWKEKP